MNKILVVGSSGFIGSNLVDKLQKEGHYVIGADIEKPKYSTPNEFHLSDFRVEADAAKAFSTGIAEAYCLGCLMGGMGYIGDEEKYGYDIMVGSTQIVANFLEFARIYSVGKVFYSSSACVYNQQLQTSAKVVALKEKDAIPAFPDLLYGWQKLCSEFMFMVSGLDYRIARFHNIFGKWGTYDGGKEKAPAAMCRKVSVAGEGDEIEVWGTGYQTRSFIHIDECLEGVERLMQSDCKVPVNIGSDELVTINGLAKMVIDISGKNLTIKNVSGNVGVMGRNSDNSFIEEKLGWRPTKKLKDGIAETYSWINEQING